MKAAQLRQSILQAAVQGKLVPQNIYDEPASKLLERIRQKKARLVKEGKIKKEKPLPPIAEDEILYDLPDGWVWCRIKDVCLVNPRNQLSDETSVAFIPMKLISSDYFGGHSQETREWAKVKSGFTHFAENDIAVAKITPCFQNGKSCIMRNLKNGFGAGTTELHILRCLEILPEYALIFVKSPQFLLDGEHNMTGTAGQQRVPTEFISNYLFPLPPLAEQQRIFAKMDELMALCDELEAVEKELDALESRFAKYLPKSILQAAVQGKLVPQNVHNEPAAELLKRIQQEKVRLVREGKIKKEKPLPPILEDEIPYDLPDGWVWCRIKDVCLVNPRNQLSDETSVAFIPMTLISSDYFGGHSQETREWAKVKSGFTHFAENDVAVAKITPCFQNGKSCIMRNLKNGFGAGTTELHILRCLEILPEYVLIFVKSPQFLLDGEHNMTGTAGQQRVPTEFISNYLFPLPPLAEQQRIIAKVDELMLLCDELKAAKDISVKRTASNIVPFPQQGEDELEIGIAARGEMLGLSDEAARDIKEMFGDDCNG